jgi:hypothetical protein
MINKISKTIGILLAAWAFLFVSTAANAAAADIGHLSWQGLAESSQVISQNGSVVLSVQLHSGAYPLDWAILSTNESGVWKNITLNNPLALANYTKWDSGRGTLDNAVAIDDLAGDGKPKVVTFGYFYNPYEDKTYAQIRIWNYTATGVASGKLVLESELNWTNSTTFGYSLRVDDINHDGHKKIITGGTTRDSNHNWTSGDIRIFGYSNGIITLEAVRDYYVVSASNDTVISTITTGDLDHDGHDEIITGGTFDYMSTHPQFMADLRVWNYTNGAINLEKVTSWSVGGKTEINSVRVADLGNDGNLKIITGGMSTGGPRYQAELDIWNFSKGNLSLDSRAVWHGVGDAIVYSVATGDVDGDGKQEVVTGGLTNDGVRRTAQIRIWDYSESRVQLLSERTWYDSFRQPNDAEIYSIAVRDVDGDGRNDIVTAGMQAGFYDFGQIRIWDYQNGNLTLGKSAEFVNTINPTRGELLGELDDSLAIGDLNGDGILEIAAGGREETVSNAGLLRVFSAGSAYGSPADLGGANGTWANVSFVWTKPAIKPTAVAWRVYFNDTAGKWNATDVMTFNVLENAQALPTSTSAATTSTMQATQTTQPVSSDVTPIQFPAISDDVKTFLVAFAALFIPTFALLFIRKHKRDSTVESFEDGRAAKRSKKKLTREV